MADIVEEHSILRVLDSGLAAALKQCLRDGTEEDLRSAQIVFEGRQGMSCSCGGCGMLPACQPPGSCPPGPWRSPPLHAVAAAASQQEGIFSHAVVNWGVMRP